MIILKLNVFGEHSQEIEIVDGENLYEALKRSVSQIPLDYPPEDIFQVYLNGTLVESEYLAITKLKPSDTVLIAPELKGDSEQRFIGQVFVIIATAVASVYLGPLAGGGLSGALAVAGTTIAASLLVNALLPPPVPEGLGGVSFTDTLSSSQMYSISGQSNQARKLRTVPKPYGIHRVFPVVAATPYTEIEVDPDTLELAQYLYAIYDFGLGPMLVEDIKIGDTSISNFSDVQLTLVDPNRPDVPEGPWDSNTQKEFRLYKGDVNLESIGVTLEGNRAENSPLATYEVQRTAAPNVEEDPQTIALDFVASRGLYSYAPSGAIGTASIGLEIHFSKVGENIWRSYNDPTFVSYFYGVGGDERFDFANTKFPFRINTTVPSAFLPAPFNESVAAYGNYTGPATGPTNNAQLGIHNRAALNFLPHPTGNQNTLYPMPAGMSQYLIAAHNGTLGHTSTRIQHWGYPAGRQFIILDINGSPNPIVPGTAIFYNGTNVGKVASVANLESVAPAGGGNSDRVVVYLQQPLASALYLQSFYYRQSNNPTGSPQFIISTTCNFQTPYNTNLTFYPPTQNVFLIGSNQLGRAKIEAASTSPVYATYKFTPREVADYKVRVVRTDTVKQYTGISEDALTITNISTRFDRDPIQTDKRHVFLELRIRATNQLNGAIQNLSATCTSALEVYDGVNWTRQLTNNPAWVFTDLLIGEVNKRAIAKNRLHLPSLMEWAEFCEEVPVVDMGLPEFTNQRFECNFILDYDPTLREVLGQVGSAAQASLNIIDGKYGVLIDRKRIVPIQIFTPRNSRDFNSTRNYVQKPHALRIKYINPQGDWQIDEALVYDDDYDIDTATEIEDMTAFGCTNYEQAWRFGRYMLAQNRLRQETIQITVDFEHLVCTRGDYVQLTQDVMKVGGIPARVTAVSGTEVTINDGIETDPGTDYGYVFRSSDGTISQGTLDVIDADTFDLTGDLPEVGDLIVIGEVEKVVFDCLIKSITPNEDLSASLVLVEKADAIYDAETSVALPTYDPQISPQANLEFAPPFYVTDLTVVGTGSTCNEQQTGYVHYIDISWVAPSGPAYEIFQVFAGPGTTLPQVGSTTNNTFRIEIEEENLGRLHTIAVLAVSSTGQKRNLSGALKVTATPMQDSVPPGNVTGFGLEVSGKTITLIWTKVLDCDVSYYQIRFTPNIVDPTWNTSVTVAEVAKTNNSVSLAARTGSYFIKAYDFAGNESAVAGFGFTTIPDLDDKATIQTVDDAPTYNGTMDLVEVEDGAIVLKKQVNGNGTTEVEYYPEGYYYFNELIDLGDVFNLTLESLVQAFGYRPNSTNSIADIIADPNLAEGLNGLWGVELQYSSSDEYVAIENWDPLQDVDPLNEGSEMTPSPWTTFTLGEFVGRYFRFRLKLTTLDVNRNVTPAVTVARALATMPSRVETYSNIAAPDTGYEVIYAPAFKGPTPSPNVQITVQDGAAGDYFEFVSKNTLGFEIVFYDNLGNPVARTFDAAVKGYGRVLS